jgi:hypothetical protein
LVTAFSREGPNKVYVQHRLQEQAKEVNELLQQKAYFYVCGDAANMAREVNTVLVKIIAEQRGIPESKAEEIVKSMRSANQYQVRLSPTLQSLPFKSSTDTNQNPHRRTFGHKRTKGNFGGRNGSFMFCIAAATHLILCFPLSA